MLYSRLYKKQSPIQEPFILAFFCGKNVTQMWFHRSYTFLDWVKSWVVLFGRNKHWIVNSFDLLLILAKILEFGHARLVRRTTSCKKSGIISCISFRCTKGLAHACYEVKNQKRAPNETAITFLRCSDMYLFYLTVYFIGIADYCLKSYCM